jgi:uncharacterized phage protein (TIGR02218 family)
VTYDARERSADLGRPVEIYSFARGSIAWRFTSADREVIVDTQAYEPAVISRSNIEQGPEVARSNMRLMVPANFPVAELYLIAPPSDEITLTLRQYHEGDGQTVTTWQGRVVSVRFSGSEAQIELEPQSSSLRRMGLRRTYQKQCPFALYGADCGLDPAAFRVTGAVAAISALTLTVLAASAQPDGFYEGGYIEWELAPGVFERRFIFEHTGSALVLDVQPIGLSVGETVRFYPGCDHSVGTCNSKFGNALNYGGMPYIPLKNPFGSDPVY